MSERNAVAASEEAYSEVANDVMNIIEQTDSRPYIYYVLLKGGVSADEIAESHDVSSGTVKYRAEQTAEQLGEDPNQVFDWLEVEEDEEGNPDLEIDEDDRLYVQVGSEMYEMFEDGREGRLVREDGSRYNDEKVYGGRTVEIRKAGNGESLWGVIGDVEHVGPDVASEYLNDEPEAEEYIRFSFELQ